MQDRRHEYDSAGNMGWTSELLRYDTLHTDWEDRLVNLNEEYDGWFRFVHFEDIDSNELEDVELFGLRTGHGLS